MSTKYLIPLCAAIALMAACNKQDDTAKMDGGTTAAPTETPPPPTDTPPPAETPPPPSDTAPPPAETPPPSDQPMSGG